MTGRFLTAPEIDLCSLGGLAERGIGLQEVVIDLIKVAQTVKKFILLRFQGVLAVQLGFVQTTPPTLRRFNNQELMRPRGDFIISK